MKLTDVERDWCEDNPSILEILAEIHRQRGQHAKSAGANALATFDLDRAAELTEEAKAIRQSWED